MKSARRVIVICVVLLIALAEVLRINTLRRLEAEAPVSEHEMQMSSFFSSLAFAPIGLGIGIAWLFFPQNTLHWYGKFSGREQSVYQPLQLVILRIAGLFFVVATLAALWMTGQVLIQ